MLLQCLLMFIAGCIFGILLYTWGYVKGKTAGYNQALAEEYQKLEEEDEDEEDDYPCDDCAFNPDNIKDKDCGTCVNIEKCDGKADGTPCIYKEEDDGIRQESYSEGTKN